ncbi:FecR family protein [Alsobacter sp. R-9]
MKLSFGFMIAALLAVSEPTHAQTVAIGAVTAVQADATASRQGGRTRPLEPGGQVFFRDTLRTGQGARLATELDDGTTLTLGENAALSVDAFVYDPARPRGRLVARSLRGAFLFVGGLVEKTPSPRVEVRTPLATLGVRGTTVWGGPIDGAYGVLVLEGRVEVRTRQGAVTLERGQGTTLRPRRSPEAPVVWGQDKVRRAIASVTVTR